MSQDSDPTRASWPPFIPLAEETVTGEQSWEPFALDDNPTAEPPPVLPPPEEPPPRSSPIYAVLIVVVVVLALALLLGGWFVVRPRLSSSPATQPASPTLPATSSQSATHAESVALAWSAPLPLGNIGNTNPSVTESGVDGIVLVEESTGSTGTIHISVAAVDLSTMTVLWSKPDTLVWAGQQAISIGESMPVGGGGVLLAELDPTATSGDTGYTGFDLVDQRTGKVLWHAAHKDTSVLAFGYGYLVTQNRSDGMVCTRKASSPGNCIWQAPGWNITRGCGGAIITGGGSWLVTATGVLDMATGAKAPFGADAHSSCTSTGNVYYTGLSKDNILRVEYLNNGANIAIQMWDIQADAPLGPPMPILSNSAPHFMMTSEAPVLIEVSDGSITAFAWGSGQQQWQVSDPYVTSWATNGMGEIAGNMVLWGTADSIPGAKVATLDIASGKAVWSIDQMGLLPFADYSARSASGDACYLQNGSSIFAVNLADGRPLGSTRLPAGVDASVGATSFLGVVGNHVLAISPASELYVLKS